MKRTILLPFLTLFIFSQLVFAGPVDQTTATKVLKNFTANQTVQTAIEDILIIEDDGNKLAYLYILEKGYVILSGQSQLPPVIAYCFQGQIERDTPETLEFINFVKMDLTKRWVHKLQQFEEKKVEIAEQWSALLNGESKLLLNNDFEQWPAAGTTTTGGWLETNWKQSAPYNNHCPANPFNGIHCVAGCPSIAIGQILNFNQCIHQTIFSDADDYYHQYAGNNYWIDNDYETFGFLSFPQINQYLDSITVRYQNDTPISIDEAAALVFACGAAAKQVYSQSMSGTFGVNFAYQALQKFGYSNMRLLTESSPDLNESMSQNMKDGIPALLAVLVANGPGGHNLVIDGYNTDNYYHLNFGWGGGYNGWYLLPNELPYNLTVYEGVIVDIIPAMTNLSSSEENIPAKFELTNYPNPFNPGTNIQFTLPEQQDVSIQIFNLLGQSIFQFENRNYAPGSHKLYWYGTDQAGNTLPSGIYLMRIETPKYLQTKKLFLMK